MGPKICARSVEATVFCAVSLKGVPFSGSGRLRIVEFRAECQRAKPFGGKQLAQESLEVAGELHAELPCRHTSKRRNPLGHVPDEPGFVALPPVGYRREIGGVGLDEETVGGHEPRDVAERLGPRKSDDSGKRDVEIQIKAVLAMSASPVKQ